MTYRRQVIGKAGESAAVKFLKKSGYKIIERNYRTKLGELDIVVRDGDTIVFVEVRTKATPRFGSPKASITYPDNETY